MFNLETNQLIYMVVGEEFISHSYLFSFVMGAICLSVHSSTHAFTILTLKHYQNSKKLQPSCFTLIYKPKND